MKTKKLSKNRDGSINGLEYNTKVGDIDKELNIKSNQPSGTKFGDYLKRLGYPSLSDMLLS